MEVKLFELAKAYCYDGDMSKMWYVKYKFYDPDTEQLKQYRTKGKGFIRKSVNSYTDIEERYEAINNLVDVVNNWLIEGNGPIELPDNISSKVIKPNILLYAINDVLESKKAFLKKNSYQTLFYHMQVFKKWLKFHKLYLVDINSFEIRHAKEFLTYLSIGMRVSNRTRNNYHTDLFNTFNYFKECGYRIRENPFKALSKTPSRSERHLVYTQSEFKRVSHYLKHNDPYHRLYIIFIICGLRCEDIVKLKLEDIDEEEGIVRIWAGNEKTGVQKFKRIHKIYLEDIRAFQLYKYPGYYYLFTTEGEPSPKAATRDYFTKKFKKVKDALGLHRWHTQYGFRHTTAIDLFKNGATLKEIMDVTGHTSIDALQRYLQQHLSTQPLDISHKLSNRI